MIRLSKSSISDLEKSHVLSVLDKEYLGMGQEVKTFEAELSSYFGRQAVWVNTGTSALHLAFQALNLEEDDEVIVQSLTYIATYQAIIATGAKPVSCEVDPATLLLDLEDARSKITSKTKAICLVHYSGNVGDLSRYYEFAHKHGLRVVEDAAHAFGTTYEGKKIGSFGDIVCFSFDGIKNITAGEGGCLTTSDEQILKRVSDARLLGVVNDTEKRFSNQRSWTFDVVEQGWRYHMSDVMAAIGRAQLQRFPDFSRRRKELAKNYVNFFSSANLPVELLEIDYTNVTPHIFVIKVKNGKRGELKDFLSSKEIQSGIHYQPNHKLTYVIQKAGTFELPVTEMIYQEILTLPLHADLRQDEQETICNAIKDFFHA